MLVKIPGSFVALSTGWAPDGYLCKLMKWVRTKANSRISIKRV